MITATQVNLHVYADWPSCMLFIVYIPEDHLITGNALTSLCGVAGQSEWLPSTNAVTHLFEVPYFFCYKREFFPS